MKYVKCPRFTSRAAKLCALLAASFVLPLLTFAESDHGKGNSGNQYGKGEDKYGKGEDNGRRGDPRISSVPEANPGIVLIPFVGAVLLFSSIQLLRMKTQKSS
jgi:hypothetical protein